MIFTDPVDAIGHTPVVRLRRGMRDDVEVYAKLELQNIYGMKDRVAKQAILEAKRIGLLREGAPIIESSSGTMALGVALVGTSLGHDVHIVTDPRIDPITLAKLHALGCTVDVVGAMSSGGWQSARLERLQQLLEIRPGAFWPQQYSNPDNPRAYRALAQELAQDLGRIDVVVGSVGSGGSLCGTARALRRALPDLRVVGVDCVGSALFDQPDRPQRLQSGLGNSLLPANLDRRLLDEVHWLNDHEAFTATRDLAREQKIFAGNTSGSVYQVLRHLSEKAAPGTRLVGIFPDRGDRYVDTVYSDGYWAEKRLTDLPRRTTPQLVPYGTTVAAWSYASPLTITGRDRQLIFVEANTTGSGMLALTKARELGVEPLLLTSSPARYRGLAETGCAVMECDTNDLAAVRRVIQSRLRREDIAGVTTTSDFYVQTAAELADWLTLPGNPPAAVRACRDKSTTRAALQDAGVGQPRWVRVERPDQVKQAVHQVGLPCVVKPIDDSGSHEVLLCAGLTGATTQVQRILEIRENVRGQPAGGAALVEQFIDGSEYSVEAFSVDGTHEIIGITEKQVTSAPHFVEHRHIFPADVPAQLAIAIIDTVRAALDAIGFRTGATHTEVRHDARGAAVIEVNPRPAGGMIPELIQLATGVDLLTQQLKAFTGEPVDLTRERAAVSGIQFLTAPRKGRLGAVAGLDEAASIPGVRRATVTAGPGTPVRPPRDAYDRLGHIIAEADNAADVALILDKAHQLITIEVDEENRR